MTQLYSKESVLKTWAARFEPILDETHWPEYNGLDYVPDDEKRKLGVGRRKKKRLRNEMGQSSGTIGIFTVPGSLTKKSRRTDVVSATRRVIGRNDINNLVGAGIR
jgi:hypothetical protein